MKTTKRIAAAAGTVALAVTGLTLVSAGTASASTWYGVVESSSSNGCSVKMYGQKTDSGAYQVAGVADTNGLGGYNPTCKAWLDKSWNGGSTWQGLIDFTHYSTYYGWSTGWMDDSDTVMRICVQADSDNTARCSGWW